MWHCLSALGLFGGNKCIQRREMRGNVIAVICQIVLTLPPFLRHICSPLPPSPCPPLLPLPLPLFSQFSVTSSVVGELGSKVMLDRLEWLHSLSILASGSVEGIISWVLTSTNQATTNVRVQLAHLAPLLSCLIWCVSNQINQARQDYEPILQIAKLRLGNQIQLRFESNLVSNLICFPRNYDNL